MCDPPEPHDRALPFSSLSRSVSTVFFGLEPGRGTVTTLQQSANWTCSGGFLRPPRRLFGCLAVKTRFQSSGMHCDSRRQVQHFGGALFKGCNSQRYVTKPVH